MTTKTQKEEKKIIAFMNEHIKNIPIDLNEIARENPNAVHNFLHGFYEISKINLNSHANIL